MDNNLNYNGDVHLGMEQALTMAAQSLVDQGLNQAEVEDVLSVEEVEYL